ncbi:unnamed protein product [Penicillium nalgiovense]|uniref:Uncharacterized protein n=1 Tax=Penicillium nalgiovense TaxID=60175 RepID=A0A9W4I2B9_PENNA|nr:unnamed protein product [Penicillium nalgiovense]CAG8083081.1 unnamed protein product [Penicillium nalgiovense]CAG8102265.1 unnamed protein product [Penicillium nalgiovense]CAG8109531.1 unnamed protein product [Penicillium nalgiovense]CAG8117283.1 unnamed protein product [Penicillium nalgiovense]
MALWLPSASRYAHTATMKRWSITRSLPRPDLLLHGLRVRFDTINRPSLHMNRIHLPRFFFLVLLIELPNISNISTFGQGVRVSDRDPSTLQE